MITLACRSIQLGLRDVLDKTTSAIDHIHSKVRTNHHEADSLGRIQLPQILAQSTTIPLLVTPTQAARHVNIEIVREERRSGTILSTNPDAADPISVVRRTNNCSKPSR